MPAAGPAHHGPTCLLPHSASSCALILQPKHTHFAHLRRASGTSHKCVAVGARLRNGAWRWRSGSSCAPPAALAAKPPPKSLHALLQLWSSFVHAFVDASHAGGRPVAPRPADEVEPLPTVLPAVPRLVAVGDLHGDLPKARHAFRLAGLIDEQDRWVGGTTTVVQVGDILDRGDQEIEIFFWLERLQREAARAGGAVHVLNGNHEVMNAAQQFRYTTLGGLLGFGRWRQLHAVEGALKTRCGCEATGSNRLLASLRAAAAQQTKQEQQHDLSDMRAARFDALRPGGELARRFLARHPTVLQVGSTLFVHGGVLPHHVEYGLERINRETQEWMLGRGPDGDLPAAAQAAKPSFLSGRQAVVWARHYSAEDAARCECDMLQEALRGVPGAQRMVVGHTIQRGINSACQGRVYRVDVGMSKGCGNREPEVLEIIDDSQVRRITTQSAAAAGAAAPPEAKARDRQEQGEEQSRPGPGAPEGGVGRAAVAAG